MFDWDDQELSNIIWGEGREADDHIVPFPEDFEKEDVPDYRSSDNKTLNEEDTYNKATEKKTSTSKHFLDGGKQEKNEGISTSTVVMDPQMDLPSLAAPETNNNNVGIAKKTKLDIGSEVPCNRNEDKELGELVGNSWANIGSFDDLDRIFSNDDLDGHTSLGSTDELWSSSKDLIHRADKSSSAALNSRSWEFAQLGSSSHNELNSGYLHNERSAPTIAYQKTDSTSSFCRRTVGRHVEKEEYAVGTTGLVGEKTALEVTGKTSMGSCVAMKNTVSVHNSANKDDWSKNQPTHEQESDKVNHSRVFQDLYTWPSSTANISEYDPQCAPHTMQDYPALLGRHRLPHEARTMAYQGIVNPCVAPYTFGNFPKQDQAMHMLKPSEDEHQSILSSSEICPGDIFSFSKPLETTAKAVKMTPQEKIEKLRRRQQMRAMLAIQKQQQQLGHQASSVDYSISQKSCQEDPVLLMDKPELEGDEGLSTLPSYEPSSPNKREDFSTTSDMDECSVEDRVVYQLQYIIARLDNKIRLCIRDSLVRLAQSATQRHYANNTTSTNRSGNYNPDVAKEEISSHDRISGDANANAETETNQIDRVVAHLLFHRPLKLSVRHAETPESPLPNKVTIEQENSRPHVDLCEEVMPNDVSDAENRVTQQITQNMADHAD